MSAPSQDRGWNHIGIIRHEEKSAPDYPAVPQKESFLQLHPRFSNLKTTSVNAHPDWCDFTQEEWDSLPIAITKYWNPDCGKPEWEPYACYDFLLLMGEDIYRQVDAETLNKVLGAYGAIWKDLWLEDQSILTPFQHTHISHHRYFLVRMPFGLRKNREPVLKLREYCIRQEWNPSKILPRVNYQSLLLRQSLEATLAVTEAGKKAIGVRNKVPLPSIREKIELAPNGILEFNRVVDEAAAIDISKALFERWNPALKTIKLFGGINTMGIVGARHVADSLRYNDFLTALDLSNNELGDDAVMTLTSCLLTNFTLQSLTLFNNKISDIGACELARLLHFNQALNILAIGGNEIGDVGAKALAKALIDNGSLNILKLDYNQIADEGCIALARSLEINGARREKDLLLLCFSDSPHEFAIEGALLDLNLSANRIGDPGALALAAAIKVNCFLHTLVLSDNKICDPGAVAIAEALLVNSTIKSLNLAQNNISDEGGAAFSELLGKNSTIQELYLSVNKIKSPGVMPLARTIATNQTIRYLDLAYNQITCTGLTGLATAMTKNKSLHSLYLGDNRIRDPGVIHLAEAIKVHPSIQVLNLCENQWIGTAGIVAIGQALRENRTLHTVFLHDNQLCGDEGAASIADALRVNTSLTYLTLGGNKIGDPGALAIVDAIKANQTIKRLYLNENRIGDTGAFAFKQLVKYNHPSLFVELKGQEMNAVPTQFPRPPRKPLPGATE